MAIKSKWRKQASNQDLAGIDSKIGTSADTETAETLFGRLAKISGSLTTNWNTFWQAWTTARAAKLDNLDEKISSRASQTMLNEVKTLATNADTNATNAANNAEAARVAAMESKGNIFGSAKTYSRASFDSKPNTPVGKVLFSVSGKGVISYLTVISEDYFSLVIDGKTTPVASINKQSGVTLEAQPFYNSVVVTNKINSSTTSATGVIIYRLTN